MHALKGLSESDRVVVRDLGNAGSLEDRTLRLAAERYGNIIFAGLNMLLTVGKPRPLVGPANSTMGVSAIL